MLLSSCTTASMMSHEPSLVGAGTTRDRSMAQQHLGSSTTLQVLVEVKSSNKELRFQNG